MALYRKRPNPDAEVETPEKTITWSETDTEHGQRLQRQQRKAEMHAEFGAPQHPGDEADGAGDPPRHRPDVLERDAHRHGGLSVVTGLEQTPLMPGWLLVLLALGGPLLAWRAEGR